MWWLESATLGGMLPAALAALLVVQFLWWNKKAPGVLNLGKKNGGRGYIGRR